MRLILSLFLTFVLIPVHVWCQTVQDDWTAPAAPDGSTPLQSGTKFTLLWKSTLQNNFETYCPACNTKKLDLWITNFNGTRYQSKIGRGLDLTSTVSYDWNVQIASNAFSEKDFWVFRFTFFDSTDPYTQQISSPGFKINGLVKAVSTTSAQSSSSELPPAQNGYLTLTAYAASSSTTSSSFASSSAAVTTSTNIITSTSNTPQVTQSMSSQDTAPKSNVWISGVVVGPIVGIALGAALTWFYLRRRRNNKAQKSAINNQNIWDRQGSPGHAPVEKYSNTIKTDAQPWQQQTSNHGHYVAEAPDNSSPREPAELWHGNYRS